MGGSGATTLVHGPELLVQTYLDRILSAMQTWATNLLETDTTLEPKEDAEGRLHTAGPVDFFRLLNDQVALVEPVDRGLLMFRMAKALLGVMAHFQRAQKARVEEWLIPQGSIEHLCAMVNNNLQCYDLSEEFQEYVKEALEDDRLKDQLDIDEVCRGFLDCAKTALSALAAIVFSDPGMQGLLGLLYTSGDWREGRVAECMLDTFEDWFGDFERFVDKSFVGRLKEAILENCVTAMIAALLSKFPPVNETTISRYRCADPRGFSSLCAGTHRASHAHRGLPRGAHPAS